jgi:hypothetical protein
MTGHFGIDYPGNILICERDQKTLFRPSPKAMDIMIDMIAEVDFFSRDKLTAKSRGAARSRRKGR